MHKVSSVHYFLFMLYLAFLSMLAFIATDMYLPAFKAIESSFNTTPSLVAMSLTTFLAGLAIGQLIYGPIVQKVGCRNALFLGLFIFLVASFAISESNSIVMLNAARFFQAIGACSAAVIWQALVVEKYNSADAQDIFSSIMPLVALSPALAPILGAHMQEAFGWQSIFLTLCALALLLVVMTIFLVPSKKIEQDKTNPSKINFLTILKNKKFLGNVIIFGSCSGAFFSYLTLWPIVMEQHGFDASAIGLSFIPQTIMFVIGGYGSRVLIRKTDSKLTLNVLLVLFGACVVAISAVTLIFKITTIFPLLIIFSILAAANGGIYPIVVNNALQEFNKNASKAAGIQNFIQTAISFGASSLVAAWAMMGDKAIGWGILICSVGVFIGYKVQAKFSHNQILSNSSMNVSSPDQQALQHQK